MNINNRGNQYAALLPYFDRIPKVVLAAIAVSYASQGGDYLETAASRVANEWQTLVEAGIVQQRVPKDIKALIVADES